MCFEVFTDLSTSGGRSAIENGNINGYTLDFESYSESNLDAVTTKANYQICANIGGALAKSENTLTLNANVGKYSISEFATSYDQDTTYQVRTVPKIDLIKTNTLYKAPNTLFTVRGEGFDPEESNNSVMIDDLSCTVLESSSTEIKCLLPEKTTDTTQDLYIGGTGARVKEYKETKGQISTTSTPLAEGYMTDLGSIRGTIDTSTTRTKVVETWFVPPQDGDYVFYAVCDDSCWVELSTTDMDKDSSTEIISSSSYESFRNYLDISTASYKSAAQSLLAGKHYYMKVYNQDNGGDDHMSIGMSINDETTKRANSQAGWKSLTINPHHIYEKFEITIPNHETAEFRIQFINSEKCLKLGESDINDYCEDIETCPCVSSAFTSSTTASGFKSDIYAFFNSKIKSSYGTNLRITRLELNSAGQETTIEEEVETIKFIVDGTMAISLPTFSSVQFISSVGGVTGTANMIRESTKPLSGSYKISFKRADGTEFATEDISLSSSSYYIKRIISQLAPEFHKKIDIKLKTTNYPSATEGLEILYRHKFEFDPELKIQSSIEDPLMRGEDTEVIELSSEVYEQGSNSPFFEVIPAAFLRTVEKSPQVIVTTNGQSSVCPLETFCDISFIADVGQIISRTITDVYDEKSIRFTGTSIPVGELLDVSIGTLRTCQINRGETVNSSELTCTLQNPISGKHATTVQSTKGAIKNKSTLGTLNLSISVSSVSPLTIGPNGGRRITIQGDYFPLTLEEAQSISDFSITLDDKECTLLTVERTKIVCISPSGLTAGSSPSLKIAFNEQTYTHGSTFTIQSSTGSVVSVTPSSVSPPVKQDVSIVLSKTDSSNPDDYLAVIEGPSNTIYMRVNEVDQATKTVVARYPGSPDNIDYTVSVIVNEERYSSDVVLSAYSSITSFSISTGDGTKESISQTGGDTIEINGRGFSTTLSDNKVVFGKTEATVTFASATKLIARASASSESGSLDIQVFIKLSIESECEVSTGCSITYSYDETIDPLINYSMSELKPIDGIIIISGDNFGDNPRAYIGEHEQTIISSSDTEIEVQITKIENNERFYVDIRTDTVSLPPVVPTLPLVEGISSISPQVGSSGGEKLTLKTFGIGLSNVENFDLYYKSGANSISICHSFEVIDSSTVTCITNYDQSISQTTVNLAFSHTSVLTSKVTRKITACEESSNCSYETTSSATPTISGVTKTNGNTKLEATISNFDLTTDHSAKVYYGNAIVDADAIDSTTTVKGSFSDGFAIGKAAVRVAITKDDRTTFTSKYEETVALSSTVASSVTCSWAGGCQIDISQTSIKQGAISEDLTVTVCGKSAKLDLDASTNDNLVAIAPSYATTHSLDTFKVEQAHVMTGTVTSIPANLGALAFDGSTTTQFTSNSNSCYVQVKFDSGKVGRLTKVRYFMNRMKDKQTNFVDKLKFQSSSDGSTWTDVFAADAYLREGWNTYEADSAIKAQYYRFYSATKEACQIGEVELWGTVVEDLSATSKTCDVVVTAQGDLTQSFTGKVTYDDTASSTVTGISPRFGTYKGGETVTITGTGFSATKSEVTVTIDGVDCFVTSASTTEVQCTSGARPVINSNPSTILSFNGSAKKGYASMQKFMYKYANYWSDLDTWSEEFKPQKGDSVVIPKGQTLIFDQDSSPVLKAVLVQGSLIFAPESDPTHQRTFDAEYIYVDEGAVFEAGTEDDRYTSKLTITMHGTRESPQLPVFGNKGIFVRHGQLDFHGAIREYTWTELSTTVEAGEDTITLNVKTDWQKGERIVIAPTDFEADHAEEFEIKSADHSGSKSVLTLDRATTYKHYSGSKDYTGSNGLNTDMVKTLEMRAEVGLLSRNVVYKGADNDSINQKYGAHIMLHSPGDDSLTGKISYVEFTQVGQAFQLGRYPIHFHMIGIVHNSYIKGNSIHHTYNRACTVHGVHYLTIENNVAYETMGHTFFIEDGGETKNILKNNLAIKTKASWSLLNTDQSPASFWITHPDNQFIGNHAAGSDRYGFWFDLQQHPTGPSFDSNVCPEFEQLGEFTGNVAHSNGRYGLRIFHRFTPVTNPCAALAGGAHNSREQPDPTVSVPIVTHFRDFLGYKNKRTAIIAEELGALKFHNVRAADNIFSGVEFGITMAGPWLTSNDDYHLQDALIVGASDNSEIAQKTSEGSWSTRGIKGARTEKMRIKDTIFANFNHFGEWGAIGTCSHCEGPATDSSGRTYFTKNLYFIDTTQRVKFDTPFKEIIYDEDGSLGSETHRWVVFYFEHLDVSECIRNEGVYNGLLCSKDISVRRILFYKGTPKKALQFMPIKLFNMKNVVASSRRALQDVLPTSCSTISVSTSEIDSMEVDSVAHQQELFDKYDPHGVTYTEFKEAYNARTACTNDCDNDAGACVVNTDISGLNYCTGSSTDILAKNPVDACESDCAVGCELFLCKEQVYNSSLAEITTLVEQRDNDYGYFDELYKSDKNFCNTNNYASIDYRKKANPVENWVFPVITNYEYKAHFKQGADFTKLSGQYSYNELLNGETQGVILHMNHTERAEAFYFDYTDSSTNKNTRMETKSTKLELADTMMGDIYMNNITRHIAIKFDGQSSDKTKFTLERDECITIGGCNNKKLPEEGEIESTPRYWSNPKSWSLGRLPIEGEDVIIESTWNMVLDVNDPPVLRSLEINGRLTIKNDGETYNLQSYLVYVRSGELIVGTEEEPFTGTALFTLHGDRSSLDVYFHDKMFEAGNKVIANTGKLRMYGKPVETKWTRLAAKAEAGTKTIVLVDEPTDWAVGDDIGIAPSGRDYTHRDFGVIDSISGNTITLRDDIVYEHYGAAEHDSSISGSIDIRAEVLHLTRNIRVQGTNEDRWGGHIVTAHNKDSGFIAGQLMTIERKGDSIIDHVEFVNCSQYDTDNAAVRFADFFALTDEDTPSSLSNSVIHNGLGIGVMVTKADGVTIDNNMIFFTHTGGVYMKESHSTTITNNIVAGMGTRYWSEETKLDDIAGYSLCNKYYRCKNLILKNNIMAGFERAGFVVPTTACSDNGASYSNNLAHSVQHGAWLLSNGLAGSCHSFNGFKAYKTMEQGIFAFQGYSELVVSDIETLDCGRGVTLMIGQSYENNKITLKNAVIMGESKVLPVDDTDHCISIYGYWLSSAHNAGKPYPATKLSMLPYEKIKSYANWFTEAFGENVTFKNWESQSRSCNSISKQKALFINPTNADHVPVNSFTGTKFENVHHDAIAQLNDPNPGWANGDDCGAFPCTAPHNAVIKFFGATASGENVPDIKLIQTTSGANFQILPDNPEAVNFVMSCSQQENWNANLCYNERVAQIMFESLDSDTEDRTISPINILGKDSSFNNTLNSFMDHCWDGHYTCQKRLSRFPGLVETNKKYELYFTGTQPMSTRYTLEGGEEGVDWLHVIIDFSQSRIFHIYVDGDMVETNSFDRTLKKQKPLTYSKCGENRFTKLTYVYEFYLPTSCTVRFEGQDVLEGMIRFQMTYDYFFEKGGTSWFAEKFASVLGISQDTIRTVSVKEGSVIIDYYVTSGESTQSQRMKQLVELNDIIASRHAQGTLDFGVPILDLTQQVITSGGNVVTSGTSNYESKEISIIVFVVLAFASLAVAASLVFGVYKFIMSKKAYNKVQESDLSVDPAVRNSTEININRKDSSTIQNVEERKVANLDPRGLDFYKK